MGLIYCSECGKQISDKAKMCPNCGAPRQSSLWSSFSGSWSSLLPSEKSLVRKSLVYALICLSLMLILTFAPVWFGLLELFNKTDYSEYFLFQHLMQNPDYAKEEIVKIAILGFVWWALLIFFIIKTYLKSGLVIQKPVKYIIGLVRNIVFVVVGIIIIIYFVKDFFVKLEAFRELNVLMNDGFMRRMYEGLMENFVPLKYIKASCITLIVWDVLNFLFFGLITLLEVLGLSRNFKSLHALREVDNSSEA